jgi:hypothetical protein
MALTRYNRKASYYFIAGLSLLGLLSDVCFFVDAQTMEEQSTFSSGCENMNGQYVCVSLETSESANETSSSCSILISNQACSTCEPCLTSDGKYGVEADCDNVDTQFTTTTGDCAVYVDFSGAYTDGIAMLALSTIALVGYTFL